MDSGASPLHVMMGFRGASEELSRKTARFGASGTRRMTMPFIATEDTDQNRPWGGMGAGLNHGCVLNVWGPRHQEMSAVYGKGLE